MPLPVTLLSGPSTSLRDDLVRCLVLRRPSLAAVVYDVVPDGLLRTLVDSAGLQHREELALTGCCLSCTVREDAAAALGLVVGAERWTEAVLALPASLQPDPLALSVDQLDGVRVDTVTTVVDALLLPAQVSGDDLLADRGLAAAPTDRRSTAELLLSQLEDADVLAVANAHRVDTDAARTLHALLSHLAPLAGQVTLGPGGAGCDDVVSTGRHDGRTSPCARERLAALAVELCPPSCGVTTIRWEADRPLHPVRLHDALPWVVEAVVRSRGHVWLADRPRHCVRWESAGATLAFGDAERWQALPSCSLLLTGVGVDGDALRAQLDSCLATDVELAAPVDWVDPFAAALGPAEREPQR